ncbi:AI-2E family transporter [Corticibacter populi]|uniref:AI-2E family transporter n=1 Tax=Corticibacter populi TaxID=1550736 RepID=A0A3M6QKL3_9BURK|nr:AI-2E family transporter [Corticibacter populi]RMX03475.1 AI-2E family transporter [Corticibacter populi]RZS29915.1 putative PurR-regulated permease PerM [Corticibacter populi]
MAFTQADDKRGKVAADDATAAALVATPPQLDSHVPWHIRLGSYLLMALGLLLVMFVGVLPGLLAACLGFLLTRWLNTVLVRLVVLVRRHPGPRVMGWLSRLSSTVVILAPLLMLFFTFSHYRSYLLTAPHQFTELTDYVARTILEFKDNLPEDIAAMLPKEAEEVQRTVAYYLWAKAGALANAGRIWLLGFLYAYVGLLIGALAAVRSHSNQHAPLTDALKVRVGRFGDAFRQIVTAQFWIASFNTALTAFFLLLVLPAFELRLPYTPALITLTFVAGLIPIVGNLLCNAVITIVGLSVSPMTALICLGFLILIHKAEYFINAKVVGQKTHIAVWELLAVMFVSEAIFGPAGLVAAPLFYAYLKKELEAARLV